MLLVLSNVKLTFRPLILDDCKKLFRDYQLSVRGCIDLSLLARCVDSRWKGPYKNPIGLSRLAETYLDRSLTKGLVTRSNWEAALSEPQLDCALYGFFSSVVDQPLTRMVHQMPLMTVSQVC